MRIFGEWARRIWYFLNRRRLARELEREMAAHRSQLEDPRRFGSALRLREEAADAWGWTFVDDLSRDARHALRTFVRNPGFALVAIASLALGIGGIVAVFSVVDPLLLSELPVPEPDRLVSVRVVNRPDVKTFIPSLPPGLKLNDISRHEFETLRTARESLSDAFLESGGAGVYQVVIGGRESAETATVASVSAGFFSTLGIVPVLGRAFIAADATFPPATPASLVSHAFWIRAFGGDPSVVGKGFTLTRLGRSVTASIVGVAPVGFAGAEIGAAADVWTAQSTVPSPAAASPRNFGWWTGGRMLARLRPEVGLTEARRDLARVHARMLNDTVAQFAGALTPAQRDGILAQRLVVEPGGRGWSALRTEFTPPLLIVMASLVSVLLITCANIAALLLARGAARHRDVAVRMAIGSGRWPLVRQYVTEAMLLALAGGAAGIVVAWWGFPVLLRFAPPLQDAPLAVGLNARVLAFALAASVASGLLFGVGPALRLTSRPVSSAMLTRRADSSSGSRRRLHSFLVPAQIALSLVVLIVGGLFLRTLQNLRGIDTGFEWERVLRIEPTGRLDYLPLLARLEAIPGVASATSWSTGLLAGGVGTVAPILVPGYTPAPDDDLSANAVSVGPRFFETMGISLLAGRGFTLGETGANGPVVVSAAMAAHYFGRDNPVGRQFRLSPRPDADLFEIVGVAEDAKYFALREGPSPTIYFPFATGPQNVHVAVRSEGDLAALVAMIRQALAQSHPGLRLESIRTVGEILLSACANL